MPLLENLRKPFEKIILGSPLHGLLSEDLAVISFTDHHTGKRLSFPVEYQKENRFIRIVCPRKEKCWRKFIFGSPVKILVRGETYQGWAEIIENPSEIIKEWKTLLSSKPALAETFGIQRDSQDEVLLSELPDALADFAILRIDVSGSQ